MCDNLNERLRRERVEFGLFLHPRMSVEQAELGRTTALLIDEAHHPEREVLEEIQLLEGLRSRKERLLQFMLVDRPELERNLEADRLAGSRQQVVVRCRLEAAREEARPVAAGEG